jgi:alpha-galactosidase
MRTKYGQADWESYPNLALKMSFVRLGCAAISEMKPQATITAVAARREFAPDAAHPSSEWQRATPVRFCADWHGKDANPERETAVRLLWSPQTLYLRFECRYREICVFEDSDANGRRDHLWERDVAEVFLQPDPSRLRYYREFEVSPNGMWLDLDIFPGGLADLKSGMRSSVVLDAASHRWAAELAIPMVSLTKDFDSAKTWRVNFFRVEGRTEPRHYLAWQPTHTPQPNFHVPEAFGDLRFERN